MFWSKQLSGRVTLPSHQSQCPLHTTAHSWWVDHYIVSLPVSCATACVLARASNAVWSVLVFLSSLCLWIFYKCKFVQYNKYTHKHVHACTQVPYNMYIIMCACTYTAHTHTYTYTHTHYRYGSMSQMVPLDYVRQYLLPYIVPLTKYGCYRWSTLPKVVTHSFPIPAHNEWYGNKL